MIPEIVQARLRGLRGKLRALVTLEGLARILVVLGLLVVLTFLFDWATPLPGALRLILTVLCAGILAVTLWRSLLLPLAGRMTDDQVAIAAERRFPDLNDRLISTVQLARLGPDEGFFNSPELVEALIIETEQDAKHRHFGGVFSAGPVARFWLLAVMFIILVGGFAISKPAFASLYLKRYLTPFSAAQWPKYNKLKVVDLVRTVAKGDDVEIKVESVGKEHPSTVTISSMFESQSGWEDSLMLKYGTSSFKKTFENVNEAFWFEAKGGDARTGRYRVAVKIRPHIEDLRLWLKYPEYTGLTDTPRGEPVLTGNVRVPAGTLVEFVATANNLLKTAKLTAGSDAIEPVDSKGTWQGEEIEEGKIFRGKFLAKKSGHYAFELVDTDGFDNFSHHKPVTYSLRVVDDRPPLVKIVKPARNNMMTPNAVLPLSLSIRDEYGIKDAALKFYKIRESEQVGEPDEQELVFTDSEGKPIQVKGEREVEFDYDFNLEPLQAKIGDTVIYYGQSRDFSNLGQPQPGRSRKWKIAIVTADELRKAYHERLVRLKDRLKSIKRTQTRCMDDVSDVSGKVALAAAIDKDLQRELLNGELDQHKITRELESCVEELTAIIEGARANKLYKEDDYEMWSGLNARLGDLAQRVSPELAESIYKLRKEKPQGGYEREFDSIYKKQAGLVKELSDIIKELERMADFAEVIQMVRRLFDDETEIHKAIGRKLRTGDSFTPEQEKRIEQLIPLLRHADAATRKASIKELRKLTKQSFGFDPVGTARSRGEAASRWEDWWKKQKK